MFVKYSIRVMLHNFCQLHFLTKVFFNTYSMKTYALLDFEHKSDVKVIVKHAIELRAASALTVDYHDNKKICDD